ncbi:AAA domain-containing protein [Candidatus Dojkabacteria bacterium]|nr:AAA domain-containing protein [Candidatus Dojkabacteria bacterium]
MNSKIYSSTILGVKGLRVQVETKTGNGLPTIKIVGRTDKTIQESKERVVAAIKSLDLNLRPRKTRINLAPTEIPKVGSGTDLAIALGIILAQKPEVSAYELTKTNIFAFGELGLDGKVCQARGIIQFIETLMDFSKTSKFRKNTNLVFIPDNHLAKQAITNLTKIPDLYKIYFISSIQEAVEILKAKSKYHKIDQVPMGFWKRTPAHEVSIDEICGQHNAKRALLIATAGRHHLMLAGPIGIGKTLLARSILSIYPKPEKHEVFEILKVKSSFNSDLNPEIPFEEISKTATKSILLGNQASMTIGKVTQAHCGIILADELAEFKSSIINIFRKPLEENSIHLQFRGVPVELPCRFQLLATTNLCPCGRSGLELLDSTADNECTCTAYEKIRYTKKIPAAILNRIDLVVFLTNQVSEFEYQQGTENSQSHELFLEQYQKKAAAARQIQRKRFHKAAEYQYNSEISYQDIPKFCKMDKKAGIMLETAMQRLNLNGRDYVKTNRIARTIADLDKREIILVKDIAEALSYRATSWRTEASF